LDSYVHRILSDNLDLQKIQLATYIFDQKVKESKGRLYPHVGLIGQYAHLINQYDAGIMTPENKQVWMVGLGINYSFFNGFRFRNKVQEDLSRANQLRHQYTLFRQGLTLIVQNHFYQLMAAQEGVEIARETYETSLENLDLVKRAYQIEILTERDLIEAQIIEALMKAKFEKSLYDHFQIRTELETILAEQMNNFIKKNELEKN
ncbi:TolC family protein, partial [bacterium]|nr:TolC family protein [candidate division CSSED10-310 bacterium]